MRCINNRAQIEKVLTGIPVMLIVFFLSGIFIFISFSLSHTKDLTQYQYFSGGGVTENSVLFKTINVDGKNKLLVEELISEFNSKSIDARKLEVIYSKIMISDKDYLNKESCLLFGIGEYGDDLSINLGDIPGTASRFFLKKDANQNIVGYNYLSVLSKVDEFKLTINSTKVGVFSYYGGCPTWPN